MMRTSTKIILALPFIYQLGASLGVCPAGWMPPDCQRQCQFGFYGKNCTSSCPITCYNSSCLPETGLCYKCKGGFKGSNCSLKCQKGFFGESCNRTCPGTCFKKQCHPVTGQCDKCVPGYEGDMCETYYSSRSKGKQPGKDSAGGIVIHRLDESLKTTKRIIYVAIGLVSFTLFLCTAVACGLFVQMKLQQYRIKKARDDSLPVYTKLCDNRMNSIRSGSSPIYRKPSWTGTNVKYQNMRSPNEGFNNFRDKNIPGTTLFEASTKREAINARSSIGSLMLNSSKHVSVSNTNTRGTRINKNLRTANQNKEIHDDDVNEHELSKILKNNAPLHLEKAANYSHDLYFKTYVPHRRFRFGVDHPETADAKITNCVKSSPQPDKAAFCALNGSKIHETGHPKLKNNKKGSQITGRWHGSESTDDIFIISGTELAPTERYNKRRLSDITRSKQGEIKDTSTEPTTIARHGKEISLSAKMGGTTWMINDQGQSLPPSSKTILPGRTDGPVIRPTIVDENSRVYEETTETMAESRGVTSRFRTSLTRMLNRAAKFRKHEDKKQICKDRTEKNLAHGVHEQIVQEFGKQVTVVSSYQNISHPMDETSRRETNVSHDEAKKATKKKHRVKGTVGKPNFDCLTLAIDPDNRGDNIKQPHQATCLPTLLRDTMELNTNPFIINMPDNQFGILQTSGFIQPKTDSQKRYERKHFLSDFNKKLVSESKNRIGNEETKYCSGCGIGEISRSEMCENEMSSSRARFNDTTNNTGYIRFGKSPVPSGRRSDRVIDIPAKEPSYGKQFVHNQPSSHSNFNILSEANTLNNECKSEKKHTRLTVNDSKKKIPSSSAYHGKKVKPISSHNQSVTQSSLDQNIMSRGLVDAISTNVTSALLQNVDRISLTVDSPRSRVKIFKAFHARIKRTFLTTFSEQLGLRLDQGQSRSLGSKKNIDALCYSKLNINKKADCTFSETREADCNSSEPHEVDYSSCQSHDAHEERCSSCSEPQETNSSSCQPHKTDLMSSEPQEDKITERNNYKTVLPVTCTKNDNPQGSTLGCSLCENVALIPKSVITMTVKQNPNQEVRSVYTQGLEQAASPEHLAVTTTLNQEAPQYEQHIAPSNVPERNHRINSTEPPLSYINVNRKSNVKINKLSFLEKGQKQVDLGSKPFPTPHKRVKLSHQNNTSINGVDKKERSSLNKTFSQSDDTTTELQPEVLVHENHFKIQLSPRAARTGKPCISHSPKIINNLHQNVKAFDPGWGFKKWVSPVLPPLPEELLKSDNKTSSLAEVDLQQSLSFHQLEVSASDSIWDLGSSQTGEKGHSQKLSDDRKSAKRKIMSYSENHKDISHSSSFDQSDGNSVINECSKSDDNTLDSQTLNEVDDAELKLLVFSDSKSISFDSQTLDLAMIEFLDSEVATSTSETDETFSNKISTQFFTVHDDKSERFFDAIEGACSSSSPSGGNTTSKGYVNMAGDDRKKIINVSSKPAARKDSAIRVKPRRKDNGDVCMTFDVCKGTTNPTSVRVTTGKIKSAFRFATSVKKKISGVKVYKETPTQDGKNIKNIPDFQENQMNYLKYTQSNQKEEITAPKFKKSDVLHLHEQQLHVHDSTTINSSVIRTEGVDEKTRFSRLAPKGLQKQSKDDAFSSCVEYSSR